MNERNERDDARDYYAMLGVSPRASAEAIRRAFRFLAKVWHPDRFPTPADKALAATQFRVVREAYEALSDPARRRAYDERRRRSSASAPASVVREAVAQDPFGQWLHGLGVGLGWALAEALGLGGPGWGARKRARRR